MQLNANPDSKYCQVLYDIKHRPEAGGRRCGVVDSLNASYGLAFSQYSSHMLQPPSRSPARAQALRVQFRSDPAQCAAPPAQVPNGCEHRLLLRVGLQFATVRSEPISVSDIPDALAVTALVVHRVASSFSDRF